MSRRLTKGCAKCACSITMKLLGIDYGSKRIGIALSDGRGKLAFPHSVIPSDKEVVAKIGKIKDSEEVEGFVIGDSRNFQQEENSIMGKVHDFKKALEKEFNLPVHLEPEFLTTLEAKHYGKEGMMDASAAAIILQSFLDKQH